MRCPTLKELPFSPRNQPGWMWTKESSQLPDTMSDGQPWKKITIVTPSYNQGQFIETTIRSVLLQGYPNLEYIIIDGGSNDKSVEIIRKYEPWLSYWVSEKDRGQAHAINKGFSLATGSIYAYLNSDDFYEPGALHACTQAFKSGIQWVAGRVRCWQEGVGYWPFPELPGKSFTRWFLSCPVAQAGCFWRSELHHEVGQFNEDLNFVIDYEFWLRFRFLKNIKPLIIEQPIAVYRLHQQSKTVAHNLSFVQENEYVREKYKQLLTSRQRLWLWVAQRHRNARVQVSKSIVLFKNGEPCKAMRQIISTLIFWPFLAIDFYGFLIAIKELIRNSQDKPAFPEMWPE